MTAQARQSGRRRGTVAGIAAGLLSWLPLALVLGLAAAGIGRLWQRGLADPRFQVTGGTLSLAGAAADCPWAAAEFGGLARALAGRSLLDPGLIAAARALYAECPWVDEVRTARRRFPNGLSLEFVLRLPAAQARHGGRYWLLDADGRRLPADGAAAPYPGLPRIETETGNDLAGNFPAPGRLWDGQAREALGLLYTWWGGDLAADFPVRRVVLTGDPRRGRRPRFDLETARRPTGERVVIRWGHYNLGDLPGEPASADKLRAAADLLAARPAGSGWTIDVRTRLPGFIAAE